MSNAIKITVAPVLRTHKELANGKHPVSLRLTFERKSIYRTIRTETETVCSTSRNWNNETGRLIKGREFNTYIEKHLERAESIIKRIGVETFTFQMFDDQYNTKPVNEEIETYIDKCIAELKKENRIGTARSFKDFKNTIKNFREKVTLKDIDYKFLKDFERFQKSNNNSTATIGIRLRTLKVVVNKAKKEKILSSETNPFEGFRIAKGSKVNKGLLSHELKSLFKYKVKKGSDRWHAKQYFLFSYLCRGINFMDMAYLEWEKNIQGDYITYIRRKTRNTRKEETPHAIKLQPEIAEILNEFSGNDPFVFPILEKGLTPSQEHERTITVRKKINRTLKKIAKDLQFREASQITFYWARHSFTNVLRLNNVPTAIISEAIGHANEATTKAYLNSFPQETIDSLYEELL